MIDKLLDRLLDGEINKLGKKFKDVLQFDF